MRIAALSVALAVSMPLLADDAERLLRVDHFVAAQSAVPAIKGQITQIYVRETVRPDVALRGASAGVFSSFTARALPVKLPSTFRMATTAGWAFLRVPDSMCFRWT